MATIRSPHNGQRALNNNVDNIIIIYFIPVVVTRQQRKNTRGDIVVT